MDSELSVLNEIYSNNSSYFNGSKLGQSSIDCVPNEVKELEAIIQSDILTKYSDDDVELVPHPETEFISLVEMNDSDDQGDECEHVKENGSPADVFHQLSLSQQVAPVPFYRRRQPRKKKVKGAAFMSNPRLVAFMESRRSPTTVRA